MRILVWINLAFGMLATGYGAFVVRGVLKGSLRGKWPTRFLVCSLLASLAGLLPFTLRLAPIQQICMVTVYCSAVAIASWLKFHLFGIWRPVFALSVTAVLYLDVVSWAVQLCTNSRLFATALAGPLSAFQVIQFVFAALFVVLGALAIRKCHAEPTRSFRPERRPGNV